MGFTRGVGGAVMGLGGRWGVGATHGAAIAVAAGDVRQWGARRQRGEGSLKGTALGGTVPHCAP